MHPLIWLIYTLLNLLSLALIVWVILSWLITFNVLNRSNRFVYTLYDSLNRLLNPMLRRIRSYLPDTGQLDIAPLVLLLLIWFVQYCLDYYF